MRGLDEVQQLASSGRTSIAANKEVAKNLYRVAGYRVAGERAVRVDILERLADLIRPALAWRDNAPGIKPQGALDGTGFTVTVGMTSLVGSSGEDFASILRSLGYRMERRPKPPEPVVTAACAKLPPSLRRRMPRCRLRKMNRSSLPAKRRPTTADVAVRAKRQPPAESAARGAPKLSLEARACRRTRRRLSRLSLPRRGGRGIGRYRREPSPKSRPKLRRRPSRN